MGLFDTFNPFTGFGLFDSVAEHVSAKDLQQRGADIDREMFAKSTAHDIDMFNRESEFSKSQMKDQFGYNRKLAADQYGYNMSSVYETPGRMVAGLKAAGLNPILAATGGFKANAPPVGLPSSSALGASAKSNSPSRGSGGQRASSNIALAHKYGSLIESEVDLNTAKAEAERAKAGIQPSIGAKADAETEKALAEVDRAKSEAKLKNAQTEGVLFDNIRKKNIANVYDDAFGQVLTYLQETGVSKLLTLGAIALGPAFFARFLLKNASKESLPKIISLGRRFWNPQALRKFEEAIKNLRGK